MERREALEAAVKTLEDHYRENGAGSSMGYTEGYFDAVAVVKTELGKNLTPKCCRTCRALRSNIQ